MGEPADVDVVVVGAGPAGSTAALVLARAGHDVILLERGPFPGAKNMYGGVIHGRVLDDLLPGWADDAPLQRWVTRRSTMVLDGDRALTVDVRSGAWARPPYNSATAYRPDFDAWLADRAVEAGAMLVCATTATGLLVEDGRVVGVRTDRPDGDLRAELVIACDGVNSFLAKEAGLQRRQVMEQYALGAKETLALPREVIDERFAVRGRDGAAIEILGATGPVDGSGFVSTNLDSVSLGVVLALDSLRARSVRPEELIADLKAHPAIAPLVEGSELKEYSAHLLPEGGIHAVPQLAGAGILVAGDAAGLCLSAGIWLEGVNFAIGSGAEAGRAADRALRTGDLSAERLADYRAGLERQFVLADHERLTGALGLARSERVQRRYPPFLCDLAEGVFTVTDPVPRHGFGTLVRRSAKANGVKLRVLINDVWQGWRIFR